MNKKVLHIILTIVYIVIFVFACKGMMKVFENDNVSTVKPLSEEEIAESKNQIYVIPTTKDIIKENTAWCASFQLIWNDIQDNLVEGDIIFDEQNTLVDNLNNQIFEEKNISNEYYYKKCGLMTPALKEEIERGVLKKFGEKNTFLNTLEWENRGQRYFLYSMIKKDVEFLRGFEILEKGSFKDTESVEYFGIEKSEDKNLREQVYVLYYENEKDFAVKLYTKSGDEIIVATKNDGTNFEEIYNKIIDKNKVYTGTREFGKLDTFKMPNLSMDVLREYEELAGKPFGIKNGNTVEIEKAIQIIQINLNNKTGKAKKEEKQEMQSGITFDIGEPRDFIFNSDFVMFFKETSKEYPYFAASINDIKLFEQN